MAFLVQNVYIPSRQTKRGLSINLICFLLSSSVPKMFMEISLFFKICCCFFLLRETDRNWSFQCQNRFRHILDILQNLPCANKY